MPSVKIKNRTDFTRDGVVTVGIPFSRSYDLQPSDTLVVSGAVSSNENQKVQWYPQGMRWDTNAVKYARASFKVTNLAPGEERIVQVTRSTTSTPIPYVVNSNVAQSLPFLNFNNGSTSFRFRIYDIINNLGAGSPGGDTLINIENATLIEGGGPDDHYARYRYFTYLPTNPARNWVDNIWVEVVIEVFSGLPYCQFFFRWGFHKWRPGINYDNPLAVDPNLNGYPYTNNGYLSGTGTGPGTPGAVYNTSTPHLDGIRAPIVFNISGPKSTIRWANQKMKISGTPTPYYGGSVSTQGGIYSANWSWPSIYVIGSSGGASFDSGRFTAGMSHAYKGSLLYEVNSTTDAENVEQILAISEDWEETYPVTGIMPSDPPYVTNKTDLLNRSGVVLSYLQSDNFTSTFGAYNWPTISNNPDTGVGGNHGKGGYAFSKRGYSFLKCSNYNWIPFLEWAMRQDACRHGWYINSQGYPLTHAEIVAEKAFLFTTVFFAKSSISSFGLSSAGYGTPTYGVPPGNTGPPIYTRNGFVGGSFSGPTTNGQGPSINGLIRSHYQLDTKIMGAFVTMDYFSLVWAATRAKNMLCAFYPTSFNTNWNEERNLYSFVHDDNSRTLGRPFSNLAFLLEFIGENDHPLIGDRDNEIIPWATNVVNRFQTDVRIRTEQYSGLPAQPDVHPTIRGGTRLLDKVAYPGGVERMRPLNVRNNSIGQPADMATEANWFPWQEGMVVNGFFLFSKAISNRYPSNTLASTLLTISRDIAATIVLHGTEDYRASSGVQHFSIQCSSQNIKDSLVGYFDTSVPGSPWRAGFLPTNLSNGSVIVTQAANSTLGIGEATGTLYHYGPPEDINTGVFIALRATTGTFAMEGSISLNIGGSATGKPTVVAGSTIGTIKRVNKITGNLVASIRSPINGFAQGLTTAEKLDIVNPDTGSNIYNHPAGRWRLIRPSYYYDTPVLPAFAVAKEAAEQGYYESTAQNNIVLTKVYDFLNWYIQESPFYSLQPQGQLSGGIREDFIQEAGYLTSGILNIPTLPSSPVSITVSPQRCQTSTPSVATAITNFRTDYTATPASLTTNFFISTVQNVITTTVSNATINISTPSLISFGISRPEVNLGNTVTVSEVSASASAINPEAVLVINILPGRKVMIYISYDTPTPISTNEDDPFTTTSPLFFPADDQEF